MGGRQVSTPKTRGFVSELLNSRREEVVEAIAKGLGIKTTIANTLGISRNTLTAWIAKDEEIAAAFDDAQDILLDAAEHQLIVQVRAGDVKAIKYLLDAKGKSRGYGADKKVVVENARIEPVERLSRAERVFRALGTNDDVVIDVTSDE